MAVNSWKDKKSIVILMAAIGILLSLCVCSAVIALIMPAGDSSDTLFTLFGVGIFLVITAVPVAGLFFLSQRRRGSSSQQTVAQTNDPLVVAKTSETAGASCTPGSHLWSQWALAGDDMAKKCGRVERICELCGAQEIRAEQHRWSEWQYVGESVGESCREERFCTQCETRQTRQGTRHLWSEWTLIDADTCKQVRSCSSCKVQETREHEWEWSYSTWSRQRTCQHCGKQEVEPLIEEIVAGIPRLMSRFGNAAAESDYEEREWGSSKTPDEIRLQVMSEVRHIGKVLYDAEGTQSLQNVYHRLSQKEQLFVKDEWQKSTPWRASF